MTRAIGFTGFASAIAALPPCSVIVLQVCAQSPTGCDPTIAQWRELAAIFAERSHFAFFDAAYPGFVSGNAFVDVECVRIFADAGVNLLIAATYGKAFGLYGERVGILMVTCPDSRVGARIEGQMKLLARMETGAQPAFGARIVEMILKDDLLGELRRLWDEDLKEMAAQLRSRRVKLRRLLEKLETPGQWDHVTDQVGMFS